jgi:uncharacterized protein
MKTLVLYHSNCVDGFTAAWLIYTQLKGNCSPLPCTYNVPVETYLGDNLEVLDNFDYLYIVDFSFPREAMERLYTKMGGAVSCFDHHKTARENCEGLDWCVFDMDRCGAQITCDEIGCEAPWFLPYVQDRDLWLKQLPNTEEVNMVIGGTPKTIDDYDNLVSRQESEVLAEGRILLKNKERQIENAINNSFYMEIAGYLVRVVNCSEGGLISDVGHALGEDSPFAATFFLTDSRVVFSLRSREDGIDVSEIARKFGGGGHKHAAGFSIPFGIGGWFDELQIM